MRSDSMQDDGYREISGQASELVSMRTVCIRTTLSGALVGTTTQTLGSDLGRRATDTCAAALTSRSRYLPLALRKQWGNYSTR